jgi:RNA polymerase subunit RPABC4/transcription elongation factor Spt4
MGEILSAIEGAVNGFLSNPYVQLAGRAMLLYLVLLWLASAYWAYRDLQSRTANPIAPYLAAVFLILFTPFLFVFGILLYKLIRPHETVEEANERALAQEAMLREMQTQHCQTCGRRVEADWLICPYCRGRLRTLCPACSRIYELDWQVCSWCGIDPRALGLPVALPTAVPAGPEPVSVPAPMARPVPEPFPGAPEGESASAGTALPPASAAAPDTTVVAVEDAASEPVAIAERRSTRRRRSDRDVGEAQDAGAAAAPLTEASAKPRPGGARASGR